MENSDVSDSNEKKPSRTAWQLIDWHAVNTATKQHVYVRELLDIGSYEFEFCKLSKKQRLDIIVSIGEPEIFRVMKEILVAKGYTYCEESLKFNMALLRNSVNPELNLRDILGMPANTDEGTVEL